MLCRKRRQWRQRGTGAAGVRLRRLRHGHPGHPFGSYLIFYRVGRDAIEVIHILQGARDYEPLLFPEDEIFFEMAPAE